jgi:sec-independent protein translocase protein TatA
VELFSPGHLIILLIVAGFVFFGWKQLPDMARSVGKSLHIFKAEMMGDDEKAKADKANETVNSVAAATIEPTATVVPTVAVAPTVTPVVPPAVVPTAAVTPPVVAAAPPLPAETPAQVAPAPPVAPVVAPAVQPTPTADQNA